MVSSQLPAALPLFATDLGLGLLGWRRKTKAPAEGISAGARDAEGSFWDIALSPY